jgi:amino acid adenylation domain-containing protein
VAETLADGFLRSAGSFPDRPALDVAGEVLSYAELHARASAIASTLLRHGGVATVPLVGLLGARSATAFAGVLGALMAGAGYVPLNPRFPIARNAEMLRRSGARALIVDRDCLDQVEPLLAAAGGNPPLVVRPDLDIDAVDGELETISPGPDATAYLLFTSGSTGNPKGVGVSHRNVTPFIEEMVRRYGIGPEDRLSQTFDLTFDLSVFDMFVSWKAGACLCCPTGSQLMAPAQFIRDSRLSVWFSVPSTGVFMRKLGLLKPDSYPALRLSLFCGEPLPAEVARAFRAAAPNAILENLYGPTEATIACTVYRWSDEDSPAACVHGVVPIGDPIGAMRTLVVDEGQREVEPGGEGELLVTGPQVTPGYWQDPDRTASAFVVPPGREEIHYRTGDRVRRPRRAGDPLVHLGRLDHQIKVLGHRVELGEIESVLREESGVDAAIAAGWPMTAAGAGGIVAFLGDTSVDVVALKDALTARLPDYMVPRRIELLDELPLNANGKFDRRALVASLDRPLAAGVGA